MVRKWGSTVLISNVTSSPDRLWISAKRLTRWTENFGEFCLSVEYPQSLSIWYPACILIQNSVMCDVTIANYAPIPDLTWFIRSHHENVTIVHTAHAYNTWILVIQFVVLTDVSVKAPYLFIMPRIETNLTNWMLGILRLNCSACFIFEWIISDSFIIARNRAWTRRE